MSDSDSECEVDFESVQVDVIFGDNPPKLHKLMSNATFAEVKGNILAEYSITNPGNFRMVIRPGDINIDETKRVPFYLRELASSAQIHILEM